MKAALASQRHALDFVGYEIDERLEQEQRVLLDVTHQTRNRGTGVHHLILTQFPVAFYEMSHEVRTGQIQNIVSVVGAILELRNLLERGL